MACPIDKPDNLSDNEHCILDKVAMTVYTYPDLQPFLEMMITLIEGVYEHAHQVGRSLGKSTAVRAKSKK